MALPNLVPQVSIAPKGESQIALGYANGIHSRLGEISRIWGVMRAQKLPKRGDAVGQTEKEISDLIFSFNEFYDFNFRQQ